MLHRADGPAASFNEPLVMRDYINVIIGAALLLGYGIQAREQFIDVERMRRLWLRRVWLPSTCGPTQKCSSAWVRPTQRVSRVFLPESPCQLTSLAF
jgi:hypothetical protein